MRLKRHLTSAAILAAIALALVVVPEALAAGGNFGLDTAAGGTGIPKTKDLAVVIGNLVATALRLVGMLFLVLMIYAGFLWMTARGDSKKVDQAKQLITGAVIGVLIISMAYAITIFVLSAAQKSASGDTTTSETTNDTSNTP